MSEHATTRCFGTPPMGLTYARVLQRAYVGHQPLDECLAVVGGRGADPLYQPVFPDRTGELVDDRPPEACASRSPRSTDIPASRSASPSDSTQPRWAHELVQMDTSPSRPMRSRVLVHGRMANSAAQVPQGESDDRNKGLPARPGRLAGNPDTAGR